MNLKFILNDYILIWNLLFQPSISKDMQKLKEKLWKNYRNSYNALYKEEAKILKDPKNYIPDDDTIFDMVKTTEAYLKVKKNTEDYRLLLMKSYDVNKKDIQKNLKDILRFEVKQYQVLTIDPRLDAVEMKTVKGRKVNTITWGMSKDKNDFVEAIISIISSSLKKELKDYQSEYKEIVEAIIELAVDNELLTRIKGSSVYLRGKEDLKFLKRQIYPYFLMYLGASKEEMFNYMMRDNIAFDLDKYTFERQLAKVDLKTFIDFCVTNQRFILKIEELEVI